MKSIRSRMLVSYGSVILLVVLLLGGLFLFVVRQYYYESAYQALSERVLVSAQFYGEYMGDMPLTEKAKYIYDNAKTEDFAKIEVLDGNGDPVATLYGVDPTPHERGQDVKEALKGGKGSWSGKSPGTGEHILAISLPLIEGEPQSGIIRYTTSLENMDRVVRTILWFTIGIALTVLGVSLLVIRLLAQRIVRPIEELKTTANRMACEDFTQKAVKRYDDEVGQLADTLNFLADELVKNEKLKNEFMSSVSHELRTPLTSIKGWSETILSGGMEDKEETGLGLTVISNETDRLIGLVEDLLDFSKLQSGGIHMRKAPLDLSRLVEEVGQQFAPSAARRRQELVVERIDSLVPVEGDKDRLKQVLINLLDNAMKFTAEDGQIRLSLTVEDKLAQVQVEDNGEGIPAEDLKHVMSRFFKASSRHPGSGLGLSICKEIVEQHGGRLAIASNQGTGTTVTFSLPLLAVSGSPA